MKNKMCDWARPMMIIVAMYASSDKAVKAWGEIAVGGPIGFSDYHFVAEIRRTSFSRQDTDTLQVDFMMPKFDPSLGTLTSMSFGAFGTATGAFHGVAERVPSIASGVNANMDINVTFAGPLNPPVVGRMGEGNDEFNQSGIFTERPLVVALDFQYAADSFDTGFVPIPNTAWNSFVGVGAIPIPVRIDFVQEASSSSVPMSYLFEALLSVNAAVVYEFTPPSMVRGDFTGDRRLNCADIDLLTHELTSQASDLTYDLTMDGVLDAGDRNEWLALASQLNHGSNSRYADGDANLDGRVDEMDLDIWNLNRYSTTSSWCQADFDSDGLADGHDFNVWSANRSLPPAAGTVPEPHSSVTTMWAVLGILALRHRGSKR